MNNAVSWKDLIKRDDFKQALKEVLREVLAEMKTENDNCFGVDRLSNQPLPPQKENHES